MTLIRGTIKKISELTEGTPKDTDPTIFVDIENDETKRTPKVELKGDPGAVVESAEFVGDDLVFTLDDASTVSVTGAKTDLKGDKGDTGATGAVGVDWQGDWSAGTYTARQAVAHNGSSWIATTTTTEEPSLLATDWDLIALKGDDATVDVGTTTTLAAGESATVTNVGTPSAAIFNFAIPQGIQGLTGADGADGACVESVAFVGNDMVFTLDDASTVTLTNAKVDLKGETGATGAVIESAEFVGDDLVFTLSDTSTVTVTGAKTDLKGDKGDTGADGADGKSLVDKGEYNAGTTYVNTTTECDWVTYNGSSYYAKQETTGNLPTNTTYWGILAQKGTDGEGAGDMLASVYDPEEVEGDVFNMDNMAQGTTNKFISAAELTVLQNTSGSNTGDQEASDFDIKDLTDSNDLRTTWNNKLDNIESESIGDLSDVNDTGKDTGKVLKYNAVSGDWEIGDDNDTTYTASDFDIKDLTDSTDLRTAWSGKQDALGFTPEDVANKGEASGYAELDESGKVPSSQLPSYVDDVLEYTDAAVLPVTGEAGKIYITLDDNKTFRWSGSEYVEISASLALGETSSTAYRGDRGKTAYDHAGVTSGNPHGVSKADVGLENVDNTSDADKPVSIAQQEALDAKASLAGAVFTGPISLVDEWLIKYFSIGLFGDVAIRNNGVTDAASLMVGTGYEDMYGILVKGTEDQNYDLQRWLDYQNNVLARVDKDGNITAPNLLSKDNEVEFTPTNDYHPATKKYVDDKVSDILNSQSTESASSITPTGNYKENEYYVTALADDLTINAPSGTASNGNTLLIRIKDNGTSRTLTFNEAFVAVGVTLPPATTMNKVLYIGAIYNSTSSKWEVVSVNKEE